METLFVYGTLLTIQGHPMHNFLRGYCDFLGPATVGGTKVELDGCLGLVPSGDPRDRVSGELFLIRDGASDKLFAGLDAFEGCSEDDPEPHQFFRHRLDATLLADETVYEAWLYLYNGSEY